MSDVLNPDHASNPTATQPAGAPTAQRRRPRLPLEFPVLISYRAENGEQTRKNGKTISVCVNGALLALTETIAIGQSLMLTNAKTDEEIECIVRSVRQKDEVSHVGIEFATWSPEFWEVTFPREPGDPEPPAEAPDSAKARRRASKKTARKARAAEPATPPREETAQAPDAVAQQPKQRSYKKPAIALAAVVALAMVVWVAIPRSSQPGSGVRTSATRPVLPPEVLHAITSPAGFSLATAQDFAPQAASWLQSMHQHVSAQIAGDFASSGQSQAYVLTRNATSWRVVILADGRLRCDAQYQKVAIAARVPRELAQRITWAEAPSSEPDGDGLLVVGSADKPGSGVVLFLHGTEVVSGTPADYQQILWLTSVQAR